jgi:CHRD domain
MIKGLIGLGLIVALSLTACPVTPPTTTFSGTLSGASEVPPLTLAATGTVTATFDGTTLTLTGTYSGLTGAATLSHIHGPAASGVKAGVLCNLTFTEGATAGSGTISGSGAAANPCSSFTWSAQNITDLNAGNFYVNIHTTINGGGEVRAQLLKQ